MANEPNNAEEQLKQYAAERRQQVPQEIHPATRNVLQGEVRRTYGSPEEGRRARVRMRWMQALAWLVVAAAIPLFLLPRNPKENAQESLPSRPGEVTLPTEMKKGEAPIVLSDTKEPVAPVVIAPADTATPQAPSSAPMTTRAQSQAQPTARAESLQRERRLQAPKAIEADAASGVTAINAKLVFANNVSNQKVLNRFQLEQTGERLKITEMPDGSVYSGRIFSQAAGNDAFQVAGVNRTLNQAAIVTGQVMRASAASLAQQQSQINNTSQYSNSDDVRVQGQAIIGNTQYKVDAQVTPAP